MSHTKGELTWRKEEHDNVVEAGGKYFAEIVFPLVKDRSKREDNMNRFCKCWNCHDGLVAACKGLLKIAKIAMPDTYYASDSRVRKAKAALAKANKLNKENSGEKGE